MRKQEKKLIEHPEPQWLTAVLRVKWMQSMTPMDQDEQNQGSSCFDNVPLPAEMSESLAGRCRRASSPHQPCWVQGLSSGLVDFGRGLEEMLTTGRGVLPGPDCILPDLQPWGRKSIQKSILVDFKLSTKLSHLQSQWIYSRMIPTKIYCFSMQKKNMW